MTVPLTAWEQAVVVVLFIVFFLVQDRQSGKRDDKWQKFIGLRDGQWQQFLHDERLVANNQRKEDREKLDALAVGLTRLTELMSDFRSDFNTHTTIEETRFDMLLDAQQKRELAEKVVSKQHKGKPGAA